METIETRRTPATDAESPQILLISGLLCGFADPGESQLLGLFNRVAGPPCRGRRAERKEDLSGGGCSIETG